MKSTLKPRLFAILILAMLCFPLSIWSQEELHYAGPFQVGSYTGEVGYTYRINKGDTVLQGPFNFRRSNLGALLDKKDKTFSFSGNFSDGFPNGAWQFQFGEFESDKKTEVVGYQYRVNVNGVQQEAKGNIGMGKPDGLWTFSEELIEDSEIKETLFRSAIKYDNGVPQQNFRIESGQSTLIGRFLRNGLAHDDWTLFGEDITETWTFDDGVLTNIRFETNEENRSIPIYQKSLRMSKTINLDSRFSQIVKLQLKDNDRYSLQEGIAMLLAENTLHYKKLDDILSKLGQSEFMPMFKVKVPYMPLDSVEKKQLVAIKKDYDRASQLAHELLENTQLNLLKRSDADAQFLYEVVQQFNAIYVVPLQKLVSYQQQDILNYMVREQLMAHLFDEGVPSKQVLVEQEGVEEPRLYEHSNTGNYEFEGATYESLSLIAQYVRESLEHIADLLYRKVENEQQQQEFVALESQMIAKINHLNQIIDSTEVLGNELKSLKNIKTNAENRLNSYSALSKTNGKLEKAQLLVICLDTFKSLAQNINTLPEKELEIQEMYKDAVWNPFMANLMDEEVKKRITLAYRNILLPHILEQAKSELDCEKASELYQLLENLHKRMLELRDEDTAKLERKLRKEKNPNTILELFNLQSLEK